MIDELKVLAERNHYLDVSEEIRSLLREKFLEHRDPYKVRLTAIKQNVSRAEIPEKIRVLKKDLKKLLEEIDEI